MPLRCRAVCDARAAQVAGPGVGRRLLRLCCGAGRIIVGRMTAAEQQQSTHEITTRSPPLQVRVHAPVVTTVTLTDVHTFERRRGAHPSSPVRVCESRNQRSRWNGHVYPGGRQGYPARGIETNSWNLIRFKPAEGERRSSRIPALLSP